MTVVAFDPLRDKSYRATTLGRDVADFLAWKELGGTSPRTLDQYERDLARGALMFPDKDAATLEDGDALHIARQFKPGERRVRVAAWNSFYKWALKSRRATVNPFDSLPDFKRPGRKVHDLFTTAEIEQLVGGPDAVLFSIMFDTGARKGDCRRLQVKHLREIGEDDTGPRYGFTFLNGKGGKSRIAPISSRTARMVAEWQITEGLGLDSFLWYRVLAGPTHSHRRHDKAIGEASFHKWWGERLEGAGVRYRNPHVTRHTMATRYLRNGGRLEVLQEILGHASSSTTRDLYVHLDMRDVLADLAVIEGRA